MLVVVMLLPAASLAWLRAGEPLLGRPLNWLEALWPAGPDLGHVVPFAAMMLAWRLLQPWRPWWRGALVLVAVSVMTELAQFLVPGRTPLVADVRDGVLGIVAGLVVASLVIAMLRWLAKRLGRMSVQLRQRLSARFASPQLR